jgi:uncharacterized protein
MDWMNARSLGYWTLGVFVPSGLLLVYWFRPPPLSTFLLGQAPVIAQLSAGAITGTCFGFLAWFIASRRFMRMQLVEFARIIEQLHLNTKEIWFLSFSAGIGEELFFRGGLQPLLGIWPTAVLFVAIHGYLNPFNWRVSTYGVAMCGMMAAIGYLTEWIGILAAITAHGMIDVVLLNRLRQCAQSLPVAEHLPEDVS